MMFDRPLLHFFLQSVWPLCIILLLLSIGLNAFFLLVDRFSALPPVQQNTVSIAVPSDGSFERGPEAFGRVERGLILKSQGSAKDFTPPVRAYVRGSSSLPTIPSTMMLYRDQGYEIDRALIESVFHGLRVPIEALPASFFTKSLTLRSVDFSSTVSIDADRRVLTVTRSLPSSSAPASTPADDIETIAVAKDFAQSLGVDLTNFGTPTLKDVRDAQNNTKTVVVWYALFNGLPLVDTDLAPLERLTVQVSRLSRTVTSARLSLLHPGSLVRSAYPTAPIAKLEQSLASGGLLPIDSRLPGTPITAEYSSLNLAYMVIAPDHEFPLYIIPVLRAEWSMKPTCKGCVLAPFRTYVPVLDPMLFQWIRSSKPSSTSPGSTSSVMSAPLPSSRSSSSSVR